MKSKKREFLDACKRQTRAWLEACADNPGKYMKAIDVALIRIALRRGWHV